MKGSTIIYSCGGNPPQVKVWDTDPGLKFLQAAVGGYIEGIPQFNFIALPGDTEIRDCVGYCNEHGKLDCLPFNGIATVMWHIALLQHKREDGSLEFPTGLMLRDEGGKEHWSDVLCGDIVVVTGDEEFMRRHRHGPEEETNDTDTVHANCD